MEIKTIHIVLEKVRPIMVKKDTPEFINTFRKVYETINHDFFIEKGSTILPIKKEEFEVLKENLTKVKYVDKTL